MTQDVCSAGDGRPVASRGWCSAHYRRWMLHGDPQLHIPLKKPRSDLGKRHGPQNPALLDPEKRPCRACKQTKPLDEFGPYPKGPLGKKYECRACEAVRAARDRARWDLDPERREKRLDMHRRSHVKGAYGDGALDAYERIQRGEPCDVCGNRPTGKRAMAIDHCHVKGHVRGILCKDCNLVLGWMKDDPKRLRALADYLER